MATGLDHFVVRLNEEPLERFRAVVAAGAAREQEWLAQARKDEAVETLRGRELSDARRRIRLERARLREAGEFLPTQDVVIAAALRAELGARQLLKDWPEPPPGHLDTPGRGWGVEGGSAFGDGGYPARLGVRLPADLAETMRRAAYWTSAPAVRALQEWDARYGDGPDVILRRAIRNNGGKVTIFDSLAAAWCPRPTAQALAEREALRAQILTTGDLLRAAVDRAALTS